MAIVKTGTRIPPAPGERRQYVASRNGAFPAKILGAQVIDVRDQAKHPGGQNFVCDMVLLGEGVECRSFDMFTGETEKGYLRADTLKRIAASAGLGEKYTAPGAEIDTDELAADLLAAPQAYVWAEENKRVHDGKTYWSMRPTKWLTPGEYEDLVSRDKHTKPLTEAAEAARNGNKAAVESSAEDVSFV